MIYLFLLANYYQLLRCRIWCPFSLYTMSQSHPNSEADWLEDYPAPWDTGSQCTDCVDCYDLICTIHPSSAPNSPCPSAVAAQEAIRRYRTNTVTDSLLQQLNV